LGAAAEGLREWATRALIIVVAPRDVPAWTESVASGVLLLADEAGAGRARLGVGNDEAAVLQADRWGAVYEVRLADSVDDAGHDNLPSPAELVALAKFIDIQCPECEVPSKEWLSASPFPLG
jgi:hypothetical protein